jgi:23S rRNA (uridine2552-2'-O)-methyltransferase
LPDRDPPADRRRETLRDGRARSASSRRWLTRQLNDPYVAKARASGYRSRAAFKLLEIDRDLKILRPGLTVVDLGAAPGGWSQVAAERVRPRAGGGRVIAIDLQPVAAIAGVQILTGDFLADAVHAELAALAGARVDVVLSDMAPAASGQPDIDHLRILNLAEAALDFARACLAPGGCFVTKMLPGSGERDFIATLRRHFAQVVRVKPPSSRSDSAEFFLVARDLKPEGKGGL